MPIPRPHRHEQQKDYIKRCMEAIAGEYDDAAIPTAICYDNWKKRLTMANELDAEIFAVGKWNGMEFTLEDLNNIEAAFKSLKDRHQVPLKMGHNDEQPFTDGQPALGWVKDIWVKGQKLMARFSDIPDIVKDALQKRLYRNVSVELDMGVEHQDQKYPYVLSGVALLGADIPAVNTLADLQAYMSRDLDFEKRMAFTAIEVKQPMRKQAMSAEMQAEIDALRSTVAAQKVEIDKLTAKNIELDAPYR